MTFDEIIGHESPIRVLKAAMKNNRIAHAYLFSGPDGIGKRQVAYALASALNCQNPENRPCGMCRSCQKIIKGNHPDVSLVEADGKFIKIEQVRQVTKSEQFSPFEGQYKVFIFEAAEKLNPSAANALLKTLEEPRPHTILILITANPQQLLPTILSRCQKINFSPLLPDQIEKIILEQVENNPEEARILARLSDGSVGWVLNAQVNTVIDYRREILSAFASLDARDELAIAEFVEEYLGRGVDLDGAYEMMKTFIRDGVILSISGDTDRVINLDIIEQIRSYSARFSPSRLLEMGRSIGYAQRLLKRNVNGNFVSMALVLELVHPTGTGFDSERMPR